MKWNQATKRCNPKTAENRVVINLVREILGLPDLYDNTQRSDEERFFMPTAFSRDGRNAPHPNAP